MWPRDEALRFFADRGEPLKVQLIEEKTEGQPEVSVYTIKDRDTFVDFCLGPHVPSTGKLKAFKLTTTSSAYWKGDAKNQPMQRVYGTAFFSDKDLQAHLARLVRPAIHVSREDMLLETGGGIAKALSRLGAAPFFAVNADIVWLDGATPALARLARAWDDSRMDALLLVHPTGAAIGYEGAGDFALGDDGRLRRRGAAPSAPFVFAGVQVLHPRLFKDAPAGPFSLNLLYDHALASGRLFGLRHDGAWLHIGTLDGLAAAEHNLAASGAG